MWILKDDPFAAQVTTDFSILSNAETFAMVQLPLRYSWMRMAISAAIAALAQSRTDSIACLPKSGPVCSA